MIGYAVVLKYMVRNSLLYH